MSKKRKRLKKTEEIAQLGELKPHPRNYKSHPDAQLEHLGESLETYDFFRRIIVARDGTILAGHGIALAAKAKGIETVPILRYDLAPDDTLALKLVALDNETPRGAVTDDLALSQLLREVQAADGLLGTGFDDKMLAELVMVNDAGQAGLDAAKEWIGMPECESSDQTARKSVIVHFASDDDVAAFAALVGQPLTPATKSIWFPRAEIGHTADKAYEGGSES
jgi:hypothetical protein